MSLANFQVFNQYAYTAFMELLSYNIALFNAATKGGITLKGGNNQGDYSDETLYKRISGLVRRRNAYGDDTVAEKELEMLLATSVKVAAATPPIRIDEHWWTWIQRSPDEAGAKIGMQLAEETMADMLAVAIKSLLAAQANVGATVVSDGTSGNMTLQKLLTGAALFGDRHDQIGVWVTHSKPIFDLWGAGLTNASQLFTFGNVKVMTDGFGRSFVVTDQPDLVYTSGGTRYHTLGLVSGAAVVEQNPDYTENLETVNGRENIKRTWQAQWTYNVGLKGYAWDKTNGGHSPTNAALATGTNWDRYATETKDLPGIIVNTQ